jgi:hypothetical protein
MAWIFIQVVQCCDYLFVEDHNKLLLPGVDMTKLVAAAQYIDGVLGRRTNSRVGSALSAKAAKEASKQQARYSSLSACNY